MLLATSRRYLPAADYPEIGAEVDEALAGAALAEQADAAELAEWAKADLALEIPVENLTGKSREGLRSVLLNAYDQKYRPEMHDTERSLILDQLDSAWKSHLLTMDH